MSASPSLLAIPVAAPVPFPSPASREDQATLELASAIGDWIRLGHAALGAAAQVDNPGMPADFSFDENGLALLFGGPDAAHRLLGWTDQEGFVPEPVEEFLNRVNRLPKDPWSDSAYLAASRTAQVPGSVEAFLVDAAGADHDPAPRRAGR